MLLSGLSSCSSVVTPAWKQRRTTAYQNTARRDAEASRRGHTPRNQQPTNPVLSCARTLFVRALSKHSSKRRRRRRGGTRACQLTRQAQDGGQAAVLSKQDVGVQSVAYHADLAALQAKLGGNVLEHEFSRLAHNNRFALGGACKHVDKQRPSREASQPAGREATMSALPAAPTSRHSRRWGGPPSKQETTGSW